MAQSPPYPFSKKVISEFPDWADPPEKFVLQPSSGLGRARTRENPGKM